MHFSFKTGQTLEAETDGSGPTTVNIYHNGLMPDEFVLEEGDDFLSAVFIMAIETDKGGRAREDFDEGETISTLGT